MKVLIIGASGLVGGNIYEFFSEVTNWELTGTYNSFPSDRLVYFDASNSSNWSEIITDTPWDIIIHTGALTHVDQCEADPLRSEILTVDSTNNLVNFASKIGSKFIYISTDYVFDGTAGPYSESDNTNPLSVYGKHKLQSENIITGNLTNYLIIRITNVYGKEVRNKNLLARIIQEIINKNELVYQMPFDQFSTPINAIDVARALLYLIKDDKKGLYHLASTDLVNRVQFLQKLNFYLGQRFTVVPVATAKLNQTAKRPLLGGLLAKKFLSQYPNFEFSNLDSYLKSLVQSRNIDVQ
jgi:dTDP-4-dehydrorhamnose reductase